MTIAIQFAVIALCLIFIVYVVSLIAREKLLLKYSLLWLVLAVVIFFCALLPEPVYKLAHFLGFENPSNFIFLVGLFFLLIIALSLSAIVSKQTLMIKNLVQEQALLDQRLRKYRDEND